ncbi:zinc ribbon domain-containing protein [Nostoc sp.]
MGSFISSGNSCLRYLDELRRWRCPSCQSENDRDENASLNIKRVGSSILGVGDVRQSQTAISV